MRRDLHQKRIIITGASSGIGHALALAAAAEGARLVLAARSEDKLEGLLQTITNAGGEAIAVPTDVTDSSDRERLFQAAVETYGGLDVLVNNAGIGAHGHFVDLESDVLRRVMEVNFFATAENCRHAIPLLARGEQPLIVNVSSMAGRRGVPAWSDYSASKFAVCGFSEALRAELARFDVDLMLVVPGLTRTSLAENLLAHKGRLPLHRDAGIPPEVVADRIVSGMKRNKKELRIEKDARLLLLVNWLCPRYVDWRMSKVVRKLYAEELNELRASKEAAPVAATAPH
ncbi:putative oxidoreductase [Planctomycetes bacterium Pan216]|uniref:Putative oxidoreductase n=1 Tax=Kolteria novifilia TaxID=2527975 RepID=A0A518AY55_9BACT|nr:putative oxidoreductase [Planctomycetes bacterium Pan216]